MANDTTTSPPASRKRRWVDWLVPRKGRWRWALLRLTVVAALLILFRFEVLAWVLAAHNFAWQKITRTPENNAGDVALMARLRGPGVRMLIRVNVLAALADVTDPEMLPTLLDVARLHPNPEVRVWALRGLRNFWDENIFATFESALAGNEPRVRKAAAEGLGALGDTRHKAILERAIALEKDPAVKATTARAVATLPPAPAAEPAAATQGKVKVAAVQFMSEFGAPELNRRRLETYVRQAAAHGAKIVVLPETAITGYMSYDLKITWRDGDRPLSSGLRGVAASVHAETASGPSVEAFCNLAGELGIYLTIPFLEVAPATGKFYNTIVLAGPDGKALLHYRKLNPWPFAERGWASEGDRGLQFTDTPYGRLALLICYDINFEPPRLKQDKVDTLLYCIAWVDRARSPWFQARLPRIAQENDLNIIGANWTVPKEPDWHGYGQSCILDRTGRALARVSRDIGEEIIYAELPLPAPKEKDGDR